MPNLFEFYLLDDNNHFKYAKGKPSAEGREFHDYDEILFFIGGTAQFISKNIQLPLKAGTLVLIPKEQFHQFVVHNVEQYQRCVFSFSETTQLRSLIREVMREVTVIEDPPKTILGCFENLMRISRLQLDKEEQSLVLQSAAIQLLIELKLFSGDHIEEHIAVSKQTQDALAYIDQHFTEPLTVQTIAKALNVSVSSLSHKFCQDLNISVYRYISEKRLSVARQYIEKGETLSNAATLSGFKDYSGFFRLYKIHYGSSPSRQYKLKK